MVTSPAELAGAVAAGVPIWTGGEGYPGSTNGLRLYQIPFDVLLPKRKEATNLLVPVALSASHVAFASLRMEPQWMIAGHAAGVTAMLALQQQQHDGLPLCVQDVGVGHLHATLQAQGAVLCHTGFPMCL